MSRLTALLVLSLFACGTPEEECGNGIDDDGNGLIDCLDSVCWGEECAEDCRTETDEDGDGDAGCADADCVTALCGEDCSNGVDDDGDGNVDCADSACFGDACEEDCTTLLDEDGDGAAGCADSDCFGATCQEQCDSTGDEDDDGAADCLDSDCWIPNGVCAEACDTETDEDADGLAGCADSDCYGEACPEDCTTTADEDGDGLLGCADSDCWTDGGLCAEVCDSVGDEDGDGSADCADSDCFGPDCSEDCDAATDEDGDGLVQCADSDCWGPTCSEVCDSPGDEDGNGLSDCEDASCVGDAACLETACNDGVDNDDDGMADCQDEDCWGNGCSAGVATLTGPLTVEALFSTSVFTSSSGASSSCTGVPVSQQLKDARRFVWEDVYGTVAYVGVDGDTANCEFNVERAVLFEEFGPGGLRERTLGRTQPQFSPACTIARPAGSFLPDLRFQDNFNAVTLRGDPWLSVPTSIVSTTVGTSFTSPGFTSTYFTSCAYRQATYTGGGTQDIAAPAGYAQAFYDGPSFCEQNPSTVGCSPETALASCLAIRDDADFAGTDGAYFIDPDGAEGEPARLAYCDMTRDGGGWTLVIHNDDDGNWADWDHNLQPIATAEGTYVADRTSTGDFYGYTTEMSGTEFLFETGDQRLWLITNVDGFDAPFGSQLKDVRLDSTGVGATQYQWLYRPVNAEDPWVSIGDHVGQILYGEADNGFHTTLKNRHRGANVFIR